MRPKRLGTVLVAILACGTAYLVAAADAAPAGVTAAGVRAADAPILAYLEEEVPTASDAFVNCPSGDGIRIESEPGEEPQLPRGRGFQCELRYLEDGKVVKGQDEVEEWPRHSGTYKVVNVAVLSVAPDSWQSCPVGGSGLKLRSKGTQCGYYVKSLADEIREKTFGEHGSGHHIELFPKFLPAHFAVGDSGGERALELGFVTERFQCQGKAERISPGRQRDSATCTTRFGDGLEYSFDAEAPHSRGR